MNGAIFNGVVVKTHYIAAAKDTATTGTVQKSEIVHSEPPFVALNVEIAKAMILANAIVKSKVDVNDPTATVEVRMQSY